MTTAATAPTATSPRSKVKPTGRKSRKLTDAEHKIQQWVKSNHGVLTRVAKAMDPPVTVQFVYHIAYGLEGRRSKGLRVEHELKRLGCPLMQKLG